MYFVLCISLMLAALLGVNLALSLAAGAFWRFGGGLFAGFSPAARARIIFFLAVAPFAAALVFTVGLLMPAYLIFEPHDANERIGVGLAVAAALSLFGGGVAAFRVFGSWWTTRRLVKRWERDGERISLDGVEVPAIRIDDRYPIVAVVGALRSRMFVASGVLDLLNDAERRAAVLHERGHLAARDNLKRVIMRISRDILIFPLGKSLERAWSDATEAAADDYAARFGDETALELASALVKIARAVPAGVSATMIPAGTFLVSEENDSIARRVERLVALAGERSKTGPAATPRQYDVWAVLAFGGAIAALLVFIDAELLRVVHDVTEKFVAALQ